MDVHDAFSGSGEMSRLMQAQDWSATPLGLVEVWPQSLKIAVRIMLGSRYAMWLGWGPDLTFLYNDAYARMTLGAKHPWALGRPAREVWAEIWTDIGPRAESVVRTGQATWDERLLLFLERSGFSEETYHTFSYSPLPNDRGGIGGMLCVVTEDTERTIGERRLKTLRELAARTNEEAKSAEEACQTAARTLASNPYDLPFSLFYLIDGDEKTAKLTGSIGLPVESLAAPPRIDLTDESETAVVWPLRAVMASGCTEIVTNVRRWLDPVPLGVWPEHPHTAAVLPIRRSGQERLAGFLVAGISPRRPFDDDYQGFLELLAGQVATAVANARAYQEERRRAEALAELDRAKTTFFSNVSHEFRTPLTLMLGPVEDILASPSGGTPLDDRELLEVVHRNGLRLQKLVNSLLDFSRIEAGRVQASYEPTDLASFTVELASNFRSACERAGLELVVDCPPLTEPVYVDREMWEKIVLNLLSNAFKFTLEGRIEVSLRQADRVIELAVSDTGTGIPADQMPQLFERFHRVEGVRGRTQEGSGIGLALVRELVRLHGGDVRAESRQGTGSTFSVTISLGTAHLPSDRIRASHKLASTGLGATAYVEEALRWLPDQSRRQGDRETGRQGDKENELPAVSLSPCLPVSLSSARPRILLADDNADMREYIRRLLAGHYDVTAEADGQAAWDSVRRELPDLLLSDVMMPRLDGFGLLRELRADPRTQALPVILLSARAGEEARVEGLQAGADDYMTKPFSAKELLARVGSALEIARLRREALDRERRLLAEVEEQRNSLREADRRKDEFLATLAHELRNPLAPLRNSLQILKLPRLDADTAERTREMMERQVQHLVRLVDDLLDVSRVMRGKVTLHRELVELATVVARAVETVQPLIEAQRHALTVRLPDESMLLEGDPVRLSQIFGNLLTNAAKYTEPRGRIHLTAQRQANEGVVRVRDTGIGIDANTLPRIFDLFVQADHSTTRSQGGLGIGLTLVKNLVELHGGTVEAHSGGLGQGSEFVVRLRLSQRKQEQPSVRDSDAPAPASGHRLLVVDDNQDAADSLAMLLRLQGHEVRVAHGGRAALEMVKEYRPEMVFLDLGMPGMDGYEVARRLRCHPGLEKVRLAALTGWGQPEDRRRTNEAGFDHHLVKPVEPRILEGLLADLPRPAK